VVSYNNTTRRHNPQDLELNHHRRESLKALTKKKFVLVQLPVFRFIIIIIIIVVVVVVVVIIIIIIIIIIYSSFAPHGA
jgi:sterol desaturase/sphingolipid hydroxylase (fatty acid hydroxylase superfamily)